MKHLGFFLCLEPQPLRANETSPDWANVPPGATKVSLKNFIMQPQKLKEHIMAKYDKNFKLICINAYENKEPLPKVEGGTDE